VPGELMLDAMTAMAHLPEAPPLSPPISYGAPVLTAVPDDDLVRRLTEAERLTECNQHGRALEQLDELWADAQHEPELALRHCLAKAWALMYSGSLDRASELLIHAEALVGSPQFDARDRAEVLYRRGCVLLKAADVAEATSLYTRALETNQRAQQPSDLLTAQLLEWRSRCYQVQRNWGAALRDAERSLELATSLRNELAQAHALFQAANVVHRQRQHLLARCYGEQALDLYRKHGDLRATAQTLNNLGAFNFMLGEAAIAESLFEDAAMTAAEAGSDADVAQAVNSLAQVYLRSDRPAEARVRAERSVAMLSGRTDYLDELGNAQLIVAKALGAEGDRAAAASWLEQAERSFTTLGSTSHLALAWVARGDLARAGGDLDGAADLYREAAEALQDWHF
jgi:tetratricopeptide (TPR) repeat protein